MLASGAAMGEMASRGTKNSDYRSALYSLDMNRSQISTRLNFHDLRDHIALSSSDTASMRTTPNEP